MKKNMKLFVCIFVMLAIILLTVIMISAPVLNEVPGNRKMKLVKSENWNDFPKAQFSTDVKTDMENSLSSIFSDLTNDIKYHCDLTDDENYYYYNDTIDYPEDYCDNEYMAIKSIDYNGHHESWCGRYSAQTNSYCGDGSYTNEYTVGISISGGNDSKNYGTYWQATHQLGWYITGYGESNTVYKSFNETSNIPRDHTYTINKSNSDGIDKLISKSIFYNIPDITYNISHSDTWTNGKWPAAWSNYWTNDNSNINWYHSRSPRPSIYSQNSLPSISDPRIINELGITTINLEYRVKIINVNFYKFNKSNNKFERMTNSFSKNMQDEDEVKGINELILSKKNFTDLITAEGRYVFVVGIVDKFNKIHIFEPEYITYDITPPNINKSEEKIIYEDHYLTTNSPNFICYQSISDNYPAEWTDTDFIWININGITANILNSEFADTFAVATDMEYGKAIKIIKENENINIDEIFLRDKAGNKSVLGSNLSYFMKIDKPEISIEDPGKIYSSDDVARLIIDSSTKIKINELRLIYQPGGINKTLRSNEGFTNIKQIDVPLSVLKGKEGDFQIFIDVEDPVGYHNEINTFDFKMGSHNLESRVYLNNELFTGSYIARNLVQELKLENTYPDFSYCNLTIQSDYTGSTNTIILSGITDRSKTIGTMITSDNVSSETLTLNLTIYDKGGKSVNTIKKIELYNDNEMPVITNQLIP